MEATLKTIFLNYITSYLENMLAESVKRFLRLTHVSRVGISKERRLEMCI